MKTEQQTSFIGTLYAIAAFLVWGLLPAYWKLLKQVPALEILTHRIFWSFVFVSLMLLVTKQWGRLKIALASKKNRAALLLSSILISCNWFIYIWAVNAEHIVETSMGYYINPLFNVFLGVVVLRERMNFWQCVSIVLAAVGVLIMTVRYGKIPWIALALVVTFGSYGLLKKIIQVDSLSALAVETLFVAPLCFGYFTYRFIQGTGALGHASLSINLLLVVAGIVTALPLLWFAQAAKMIPLSRLGFLQYLAPTIALVLGVFVYHEPFNQTHVVSFGCIWTALIIYSFSQTHIMKRLQPAWFAAR